ncbi:MAG: hypothetical protein OHK0024_35930 [Thalassobaculales bacterium]
MAPREPGPAAPPDWLWPLMQYYALPSKPSVAWAVEQLPAGQRPALRTAQRVIAGLGALARNRGRMGPREMKRLRAYTVRSFDQLEPLDVITGDGHRHKVEVIDPETGRPLRPEIVTWADVATRRVVGWSVGRAESAILVADALAHVARSSGVPAIVYTDRGCGFVADHLTGPALGVLDRLGAQPANSIAWNAQARGVIERLNATLWVRAAKALPGFMGEDMDRQARDRAYRQSRAELQATGGTRVLQSWPAFIAWAEAQVAAYNARPHSSLPRFRDAQGRLRHQSPDERWAEFAAAGWAPIALAAEEVAELFRPRIECTVVRAQVRVWGQRYYAEALEDLDQHGRQVAVAYDIHDPSRVWVYGLEGGFLCTATLDGNVAEYFPRSVIEQARERRVAAQLGRLDRKRAAIEAQLGPPVLQIAAADGETVLPPAEIAAMDVAVDRAALPAPAASAASEGRPPHTASDIDLAAWLAIHPDRATDQDRAWLRWFLASPAWPYQTRLLAARQVDVQLLRGLAAATAITA